jgi:hypothetical protein
MLGFIQRTDDHGCTDRSSGVWQSLSIDGDNKDIGHV